VIVVFTTEIEQGLDRVEGNAALRTCHGMSGKAGDHGESPSVWTTDDAHAGGSPDEPAKANEGSALPTNPPRLLAPIVHQRQVCLHTYSAQRLMQSVELVANKRSGQFRGAALYPHKHADGTYVATTSKFEVDYVRVDTLEELRALINAGYGARMSNPDIPQPASYITRNHIDLTDPSDPQVELRNNLAKFASEKSLDRRSVGFARKEQAFLRAYLLNGKPEGYCSLCRRMMPSNLLVAAHIKPRNKCEDHERLDFDAVATLMCSLGCHRLFEHGYVYVEDGRVRANARRSTTADLKLAMHDLLDKEVSNWSFAKKYYIWHGAEYRANAGSSRCRWVDD
jgi:hypothetical protein